MNIKDIINPTTLRQGYHPNQAPPAHRKGAKDNHVSAGYYPRFRISGKQYLLILAIGLLLLVGGAGFLVQQMVATASQQKADADLRSIYYAATLQEAAKALTVTVSTKPQPTVKPAQGIAQQLRTFVTPKPMLTYATKERFLSLININSDVVGWLTIQDVLDLPVVQRDNTFYLTHSFQGKPSYSGTLFLDQNFSIVPPHENLLIHGHNMRDGSMFGQLLKYRKKSFYIKHWLIQFETLHEDGNYVIFAAFDMVNDVSSPAYYPYSYSKFDTDIQFEDYITGVKLRSLFKCDLSVLPTDTLLTLSTCAGGGNNYLVIVARKIRDGENLPSLTTTCLMSTF